VEFFRGGVAMATKIEVMNFLNQKYDFDHVSDNMVKFVFNVDGGRTQLVFAWVNDDFMVISSPFASEDAITPNLAFKLAEDSLFGIKKIAGMYQVTHVVPMGDVDESEIAIGLALVANAADGLESSVGGDSF
jgi:hypothetical protein